MDGFERDMSVASRSSGKKGKQTTLMEVYTIACFAELMIYPPFPASYVLLSEYRVE